MIEIIDPEILSVISGFFIVIIILIFAWKSGYFGKQFSFAKSLPVNIPVKDFFILMFKNSIPTVISYMKWLFGYFIRIAWYLIIFIMVTTGINDFETSFLIIFAIISAKVSMVGGSKKGKDVIVLSEAEHERIIKGESKFSDFKVEK